MSTPSDIDRLVADWLDQGVAAHTPPYLDELLDRTRQTRQRPAWSFPARWVPAEVAGPTFAVPRVAWLLLLGLAAMIAYAAITFAGAHRLPPPFGLARPGLVAFEAGGHIFTARSDGTDRRQLTSSADTDSNPVWSPDGMKLAFWRKTPARKWEIVITDEGGKALATIPLPGRTPNFERTNSRFAWAPDSQRLAFSLDRSGLPGIWTANADGTGLRQLGDPCFRRRILPGLPTARRSSITEGTGPDPTTASTSSMPMGTGLIESRTPQARMTPSTNPNGSRAET